MNPQDRIEPRSVDDEYAYRYCTFDLISFKGQRDETAYLLPPGSELAAVIEFTCNTVTAVAVVRVSVTLKTKNIH